MDCIKISLILLELCSCRDPVAIQDRRTQAHGSGSDRTENRAVPTRPFFSPTQQRTSPDPTCHLLLPLLDTFRQINLQSSTIHQILTQSENSWARAPPLVFYYLVLLSLAQLFSYCGQISGSRKDCGGLCQEVERVGSNMNCSGSLCLKVLPLQPVSVSHPDNALQAYCWIL